MAHRTSENRSMIGGRLNVPLCDEEWRSHLKLKRALRNRRIEEAERLIRSGVPVNVASDIKESYHNVTPLHLAVSLGCPDLVKNLLDRGASVNTQDIFSESPLTLSVRLRRYSITDLLLTVSDIKKLKCKGLNPGHLHIACMRNNISVVKKLIEHGANVNEQVDQKALSFAGYTPLHFAVENHAIDIVQVLVDNGASVIKKNAYSLTPLHLAHEVRDEDIIDILLLAHMFEPGNPQDKRGLSHFHVACTRNNVDFVRYFLQQEVDVNSSISSYKNSWSDWQDYEPLRLAIHFECPDIVELLLLRGAELRINECDNDEANLNLAYGIGNERIIDLLLNHKFDSSEKDTKCENLSNFQLACAQGDIESIKQRMLFRSEGTLVPELTSPIWNASMPLHYLVKYLPMNELKTIKQLQGYESIKDSRGETALHILFKRYPKDLSFISLINLFDFEQNPADKFGLSHFHIACTMDDVKLIEKFLRHGADVNSTIDRSCTKWPSYTPLHIASKFKLSKVVDSLLKHGADIRSKNRSNFTALDLAIFNLKNDSTDDWDSASWEIIWKILFKGQELSDREFDRRGFSLLHVYCATRQDCDISQLSIYLDSLPDGINQVIHFPSSRFHLYTPLHFAVEKSSYDIAKWLVEKGANVHSLNCKMISPFQIDIERGGSYGISKNSELLRTPGNPSDFSGYTYFHLACIKHDRKSMEYYLNSGVDVNLKKKISIDGTCDAKTPLLSVLHHTWSGDENVMDTVRFLISSGANVKACDAFLNTPLHFSENLSRKLMIQLIEHGTDVNARNFSGDTPLIRACKHSNSLKRVVFLLEQGADINVENYKGETALTYPCEILMASGYSKDKLILNLIKHVKKLMVIGAYVSDKNREMYYEFFNNYSISKYDDYEFGKECKKEIRGMKDLRINRYTNLFNIVFKTPNEMANLSQNAFFRQVIDSPELGSNFPIYGYMMKLQYRRGIFRRPVLEKCKKVLYSLARFSGESAEKILDYLDDDDLENIIRSEKLHLAA
ncbi:hypothetical protein QAD02_005116 [Eretmocerus hayati]|uniref:Uncharacterized protein n=1 Tax=Eretmocerus hayati TaxID=131215 RepID=A0ACC2NRH2_9HYME|nr:hypothetical protein QAD02_005116 [Eretmocerus hayati]